MVGSYRVSGFPRHKLLVAELSAYALIGGGFVHGYLKHYPLWGYVQFIVAAAFFTAFFAKFWRSADHFVLAARWDDDEVTLCRRRGGPLTANWDEVREVGLPVWHGNRRLAYGEDAILFLKGQAAGYVFPLSRRADCEAFLKVLERKARVVRGDKKSPRGESTTASKE